MKEKGSHYLEANSVVYPNFKYIDNVIFPNQVFVTTGNGDKVKPEFNKMIEEDNKTASKEGFFSNQSTVKNNHTTNSYSFQVQKPQRTWVVKTKQSKTEKPLIEVVSQKLKLDDQIFKDKVKKISKENEISKIQAKKKVFLNSIESQKNQTNLMTKSFEKKGSKPVKTSSQNKSFLHKTVAQHQNNLSTKTSQRSFLNNKLKVLNFDSKANFPRKNNENFQSFVSNPSHNGILKLPYQRDVLQMKTHKNFSNSPIFRQQNVGYSKRYQTRFHSKTKPQLSKTSFAKEHANQ